jgi:hypothetical protein
MTDRRQAIAAISDRLGRRDLIWCGLRADDIEAISDLPQVAGSFSTVGGYNRGGAVPSLIDFEDLSGVRADLDGWDIEDHLDEQPAHAFREAILSRLAARTALLPYRPSNFISSLLFARRDRCIGLGLFGAHQAMFEHKPWVETNVAALGLPRVPWVYVADEERMKAYRMLSSGPIMLRVSRSSGGAGLVRVDTPDELEKNWLYRPDAFVSVTPFLADIIPVNISATVWHDGVTMHRPSVQLIGLPQCTTRSFGYCGNDFAMAANLDDATLDTIETSVIALGRWLRRYDYIGTFGVDFLVHHGTPLFIEINPRFQGSTHASSQLSSDAGESCAVLDHLAAVLGMEAPPVRPLREIARSASRLAHLVIHWIAAPAHICADPLVVALRRQSGTCRVDVCAKPSLLLETGATVVRATIRGQVTTTGFDLREPWRSLIEKWLQVDSFSALRAAHTVEP